ncbi:RNA polymerase sigma factor (sigma-70 family) [Xanthomonas sp. JAI131]|uniref:RNA polymerase sigma factor n=1 Tax=unclassified Xanthomonas TaxID=2643310 RepID=UPI0015CC7C3B|nr:sigma-70 family RNA polymerase sigma factor [Xanthomonas sp. JAI131]NYF21735.1 RNA polymerase sigma factor (sigma-70 family) [Xanthomonas sp. JAI131]
MSPTNPAPETDRAIAATVLRERSRLGNFIRRRVLDRAEAEDILQDVLSEFVQAYRLPAPIEQASAWLFQVARNRIIDRFRKRNAQPLQEYRDDAGEDADDDTLRLDLALPAPGGGPDAAYARARLLLALQQALDELPQSQSEVFVAHEFEGRSFKQMAADSGIAINTLLARKRYAVLYLRARLQTAYDELES